MAEWRRASSVDSWDSARDHPDLGWRGLTGSNKDGHARVRTTVVDARRSTAIHRGQTHPTIDLSRRCGLYASLLANGDAVVPNCAAAKHAHRPTRIALLRSSPAATAPFPVVRILDGIHLPRHGCGAGNNERYGTTIASMLRTR